MSMIKNQGTVRWSVQQHDDGSHEWTVWSVKGEDETVIGSGIVGKRARATRSTSDIYEEMFPYSRHLAMQAVVIAITIFVAGSGIR